MLECWNTGISEYPAFVHDALAQLKASSRHRGHFDFWIFVSKGLSEYWLKSLGDVED